MLEQYWLKAREFFLKWMCCGDLLEIKMDKMKLSFMVEVTGCHSSCPHLGRNHNLFVCIKSEGIKRHTIYLENAYKLTKSCPMIKKQFEMLE